MKAIKSYGCTVASFTFDGKEYEDMLPDERKRIEDIVLQNIRTALQDQSLSLDRLIDCLQYEEWETSGTCDQCNDSVNTTTWHLYT